MAEDFAKKLGSRIRHIRRNRGYTQESLADLVGTSQSHLGKIERGEVQVGTELLQKLANSLLVDIGQFFGEHKRPSRDVLLSRSKSLMDTASDRDLYLIYKILDSILN